MIFFIYVVCNEFFIGFLVRKYIKKGEKGGIKKREEIGYDFFFFLILRKLYMRYEKKEVYMIQRGIL